MKIHSFDEFEKSMVFEYHAPGSINENEKIGPNTEIVNPEVPQKEDDTIASVDSQPVKLDNYDDSEGKKAEDTPLGVDVDRPSPDKDKYLVDTEHWSEHHEEVYNNLKNKASFYVQGESGWGKTAVITQMCHTLGYTVITVYVSYAQPEDLDGMKLPMKDDKGNVEEVVAPPPWASFIMENPNEQFVLFLDNLNQVSQRVLNVLMPVVLEHKLCDIPCDNFFCVAAGNMSYEGGLEELPRLLMSHSGLRPIAWISGTQESWDEAFKYLHRKWDSKLDPKLIKEFHKKSWIFDNPRSIEIDIFKNLYSAKERIKKGDKEDLKIYNTNYYEDVLTDITKTKKGTQRRDPNANEFTPEIEKTVHELAEKCYVFLKRQAGGGSSSGDKDEKQKGEKGIVDKVLEKPDVLQNIIDACVQGTHEDFYFLDNKRLAPITHETIFDFLRGMNADLLEVVDEMMEEQGLKWKYPHNEDAVKDKKRNKWKTYDWSLDENGDIQSID